MPCPDAGAATIRAGTVRVGMAGGEGKDEGEDGNMSVDSAAGKPPRGKGFGRVGRADPCMDSGGRLARG